MRFLLNLRLLKSEDQEYKSRHLAAHPGCARGIASSNASFGILTGVEDLLDQFELDDVRMVETSVAMQGMVGDVSTCNTPLPPSW